MTGALVEAESAGGAGEVPVGAILVSGGKVVARAGNRRHRDSDPAGHAEILVLREGSRILGDWRLTDSTLYVTLEPCPMCAGAIVLARVGTVVFGASDPRYGAGGSAYNILEDGRLNHRVTVIAGVMEDECRAVLGTFFDAARDD